MKLHKDADAFRTLIEKVHDKTKYRRDVLEKDYYVVLLLKELSQLQKEGLNAFFKGGTALYKALKTTNRFSEDIDISVDTRNCSRTQNEKLLGKATKEYKSLIRNKNEGFSHRSEVVTIYEYNPIVVYDKTDALQRFGKVKVEATSFTISEPTETLEIAPMLYELADSDFQNILKNQYDVVPFKIQIMSLDRIFIDKLFATEAYTRKSEDFHKAFEAAKHIYDLSVLSHHSRVMNLYKNSALMAHLLNIRLEEEKERLDGIPGVVPSEFTFFESIKTDANIKVAYEEMQRQYVLRDQDKIEFDNALVCLQYIKGQLVKNVSWLNIVN